jgi:hypothetical protein
VVGFSEHGSDPTDFMEGGEFLDQLSDYDGDILID